MGHIAHAQDLESDADYVNAHNIARCNVSTRVSLPNVVWDDYLGHFARVYAYQRTDCKLIHSGDNSFGENIFVSDRDINDTDAVKLWVNHKRYYDSSRNKCVGGECHQYTQIVWRKSVSIGCYKVKCKNGGTFVICYYAPRGNILGEAPY
ncbi:basic form of pathogenesis-related protein 1-like [Cicer arietinum]|uniref:Basic form of pathogenesis-related protein 1-like n=1 Tax=Cicer arietinum TaxID=3827 RepID=A0A1S2XRE5_CICAR|nr:basic form of pathogenesis-related protein 1-like [Cicer arietinum]